MKVVVHVMPREQILDTQGRTVLTSLKAHQFSQLLDCRVGKRIELEIEAKTNEEAAAIAKNAAEFLLVNPLIENYRVEVL